MPDESTFCGICGKLGGPLTKTKCCNRTICDDEHLYVRPPPPSYFCSFFPSFAAETFYICQSQLFAKPRTVHDVLFPQERGALRALAQMQEVPAEFRCTLCFPLSSFSCHPQTLLSSLLLSSYLLLTLPCLPSLKALPGFARAATTSLPTSNLSTLPSHSHVVRVVQRS